MVMMNNKITILTKWLKNVTLISSDKMVALKPTQYSREKKAI